MYRGNKNDPEGYRARRNIKKSYFLMVTITAKRSCCFRISHFAKVVFAFRTLLKVVVFALCESCFRISHFAKSCCFRTLRKLFSHFALC